MRRARRAMAAALVVAASKRIQQAVMALPEFREAKAVGTYLALPYEVQTRQIVEACWSHGKRICVPAYNEDKGRYEMRWIRPEDKTTPGHWLIHEPQTNDSAGLMDVDLLVVPALAYDRQGGRLGHGGGHFDRILGSWSGLKIGVAFDFQVFDRVPMGSQDIPVDMVVTEKTIYAAGRGAGVDDISNETKR